MATSVLMDNASSNIVQNGIGMDDVDMDDESLATRSSAYSNSTGTQNGQDVSLTNLRSSQRSTWPLMVFTVFLGAAAAAAFMWLGISSANQQQQDEFQRVAQDTVYFVERAFDDYVNACSIVHARCRHGPDSFTRQDFRELHEYLVSSGLQYKAVQFDPNVTHAERPFYEAEMRAWLAENYPEVDYAGFRGFNTLDSKSLEPRTNQPFYFPIHYMEPIAGNEAAIDLDYWSSESRIRATQAVFDTKGPSLTDRLSLVKKAGEKSRCGDHGGASYGVVLMHPGVALDSPQAGDEVWPKDFSSIVLCVPDLLERATASTGKASIVYIHDQSTPEYVSTEPVFMGGVKVLESNGGLEFLDEVPLPQLEDLEKDCHALVLQYDVQVANRVWTVTVQALEGSYQPSNVAFVVVGGCIIFVASLTLAVWLYNNVRRARELEEIIRKGEIESNIVSSLFPSNIRDRLMKDAQDMEMVRWTAKANKKSSRDKVLTSESIFGSKPIADLFPETTVLFADLVGFTAWSSVREPAQVFTLLESIYYAFDVIAARRKIFKVETVGDCYVAVAGLPDPRVDHAVAMARFASDCLNKMGSLTKMLETSLGPDTGDLDIRIGLHSGPVTAGVLRGDKGRFQLFGDTVNTASRMESNGKKGRIHISSVTAALLVADDRGDWVAPREDKIVVKGKGEMTTYWLVYQQAKLRPEVRQIAETEASSLSSADAALCKAIEPGSLHEGHGQESVKRLSNEKNNKQTRLVDWNVEVLSGLLKNIQARRAAKGSATNRQSGSSTLVLEPSVGVIDEVKDILTLPEFDAKALKKQVNPDSIELDPTVIGQLRDYIGTIGSSYQDNPFHNFEHASHVTMSVTKLMSRIVNPREVALKEHLGGTGIISDDILGEAGLHDYTFGITSDPLTQFACVLSALIHDVDHPGVPNTTLVAEEDDLANRYKNKCVAEQNSVDLAWNLLMEDHFRELRECIAMDKTELSHFRQLVITVVMATDIMDKGLGAQRKERWQIAFAEDKGARTNGKASLSRENVNRKATIVIEHLIQASDVAHTMQHWHVYVKWNERLFHEMYRAYKQGRLEKDPSTTWYEGEKGFFDFYVIPLAKKLDTCGVFGVSSTEYLNYATANRQEWEVKGRAMVEEYLRKHGDIMHD